MTAEPKSSTRQLLGWGSAPGFSTTKTEILRRHVFKRDVGLTEFGEQTKKCAVHDAHLQSFSYGSETAPTFRNVEVAVSREFRCKPIGRHAQVWSSEFVI